MSNVILIVAAVVILAVLVGLALWYSSRRRTEQLRDRFGPEYERAVAEKGDTRRAEADLAARQKRVAALEIHELNPDERRTFADEWRTVQAHFVDDPPAAVAEADRLVGRVMEARGYPVGDFDQRAADVSVDHPDVVDHYRRAHGVALRQDRGDATTEDLRQAMVDYRALFADLLEEPQLAEPTPNSRLKAAS